MNNFNFIIGFNDITSSKGRIIPGKKFISYFLLRNLKNAHKSINKRLNILSPNSTLLDNTDNAFPFNSLSI